MKWMSSFWRRLGLALLVMGHFAPAHAIGVPFFSPLDLSGKAAGYAFAVTIADDPAAVPASGFVGADIEVYWDARMLELSAPFYLAMPIGSSAFGSTGYISGVVGLDVVLPGELVGDGILDGLRLSIDTTAPRSGPYSSLLFELEFTLIADGAPTQFDVYPTYYEALPPTAPIPEPATVALTLAGLGLLGVAARRRRG